LLHNFNPMLKFLKFFCLLILLSACSSQQIVAQNNGNKKAQILFQKADEAFVFGRYNEALEGFEAAIKEDPKYTNAYLRLVELYQNYYKEYQKAIDQYLQIIEIDSSLNYAYFAMAQCHFYLEEYDKTIEFAKLYASKKELVGKEKFDNDLLINSALFAKNATQNPVAFEPVNLGPNINSEKSEYYPSITADGEWLYFTVNDVKSRYPNEDIYAAKFENGVWKERKIVERVNTQEYNEGAHSITQDGRYLFFASNRKDMYASGMMDIYIAKKIGEKWQKPVNMGRIINSRNWESQPVISADSKMIFFVRKSDDGFGGTDIYYCTFGSDGKMQAPVNIGEPINTMGDEQRPYLHPDGKTLYFSSNGHPGLGQSDIFKSNLQEDGTWSTPINLGYPLNSKEDEYGLYVSADGEKGFISSDREGGYGQQDIYSFEMPKSAKPNIVLSVKGVVYDANTNTPLKANVKIIDIESGVEYKSINSDQISGEFLVTLVADKNYILQSNADDYLPFSANFSLKGASSKGLFKVEAPMQSIAIGNEFILENIFFDAGKYTLKEVSKTELNVLVSYLLAHPSLKIEIGGHTDNDGTELANQELSEKRAKAVYDYLINQNISSDRLSYKGYGESQPITTNDSVENKAKNRRTAFKIMD